MIDQPPIIAFGTYNLKTHPRFQVMLEGMQARGYQIRQLRAPLEFGTADRVAALGSPRKLLSFIRLLLGAWALLIRRARRYVKKFGQPQIVMVGYMGHFDVVLARLLFPRATIVLDHLIFAADTAKDRGAAGQVLQRALRFLDSLAQRCATLIVVDTPEHAAMVPPALADRAVVVPVGAPTSWFAARRPADAVSDPLTVVFFGLFTPLQGAPAIASGLQLAAAERPMRIVMVGSGQDLAESQSLLTDPAAEWIPWLEPDALRRLVAESDVCLGILGETPKALHVVPNKVYQGAAAGCAIVTSDTEPQRAILGDAVHYVSPGDSRALADFLVGLSPDQLVAARAEAAELADRCFRPAEVVAPLADRLC